MSEAWNNGEQPMNRAYNNGGAGGTFGSRNFNNSNYRGPRRNNGAPNGGSGYQGNRYSANNGGGYGNNPRSNFAAARQYGDRQPRLNFNGTPRAAGGYNNFDPSSASSKIDIDSNKGK